MHLIIIIIIIITATKFFTPALSYRLSQEPEWPLISSSLHDSSQDSGWSYQCCYFDGFSLSSDFQLIQKIYKAFKERSLARQLQLEIPSRSCSKTFLFSSKVQVLISLFTFFDFHSAAQQDRNLFFCCLFFNYH